jgi:hypothetical protein
MEYVLPPPHIVLDSVSIWWIFWCSFWTICVLTGMLYLFTKRRHPSMRTRGLSLTLLGVTLLHIYWIVAQLLYVLGPLGPEMTEFWITALFFPAGLACFQAANSQLLLVARIQEKYSERNNLDLSIRRTPRSTRGQLHRWLLQRFRQADNEVNMLVYISWAMFGQVCFG